MSSDAFLTPCLQDKYKENLNRNKKEPEEGRDCQGKGEDLSADAESCSVSKGENKYLKELKDPKIKEPKIDTRKTKNTKTKTHSTNLIPQPSWTSITRNLKVSGKDLCG